MRLYCRPPPYGCMAKFICSIIIANSLLRGGDTTSNGKGQPTYEVRICSPLGHFLVLISRPSPCRSSGFVPNPLYYAYLPLLMCIYPTCFTIQHKEGVPRIRLGYVIYFPPCTVTVSVFGVSSNK